MTSSSNIFYSDRVRYILASMVTASIFLATDTASAQKTEARIVPRFQFNQGADKQPTPPVSRPLSSSAVKPIGEAIPTTASGSVSPALHIASLEDQPGGAVQLASAQVSPIQDPNSQIVPGQQDLGTPIGEISQQNSQLPGLKGPVRIFYDSRTNRFTLIGDKDDCAIVEKAIQELRESSEDQTGLPAQIPLRFSNSEDIIESIRQVYDANFANRTGAATIEALRSPNALLVFGSPDAIKAVRDIVAEIESGTTVDPEANFASFKLKHLSATDAKRRLEEFFQGSPDQGLPAGAVTVIADYRSNVIVVRGAAQFLEQAKLLIGAIDIDKESASTKAVRVFPLSSALAADLAIILQDTINGALRNVPTPIQAGAANGGANIQPGQPGNAGDEVTSEVRSARLQIAGRSGEVLSSGLLFDVRITPNTTSNSLIVRAPASAMPLIEELIRQLDQLPNAETVIKVFQIYNGDAQQLLDMLEQIFGVGQAAAAQGGNAPGVPLQSTSATPGSSLVNLRFAIDQRTNSIIATGPVGEMQVVEDLLNRLDEDLRSRRKTIVYRLSNANVLDVEESLNNLLDSRSDRNSNDPRTSGGSVLADQEIVVVPELGSNSLIISALPENFPEIENVIRRLDRRPPMVKVKVLIAEIDLSSTEEFGIELGLQDSLLFDRGIAAAPAIGDADIGFNFNSSASPNSTSFLPGTLGSQAISNLGLGRINTTLGFGGLVLSAGSDSVNVLLRALKDRNCLRVLSKPHIMTLENLQGRVSVGQSVPRITDSQQTLNGGISNGVEDRDVGVILEITPRVSPDGMIVMFVNVIKSSLAPAETGVAVAVDNNGNPVLQAPINATEAQTTIMSRSGQTTVFSGLIQETKTNINRGAPILSDLPIIGPLFKFESDQAARSELLIIMTPYLIDTDEAIDRQNQDEMERMNWCICDVAEVYGNTDFDPIHANIESSTTVYPDDIYQPSQTGAPQSPPFENVPNNGSAQKDNSSQNQNIRRVSGQSGSSKRGTDGSASRIGTQSSGSNKKPDNVIQRWANRVTGKDKNNESPFNNPRNRQDFEELKRLNKIR